MCIPFDSVTVLTYTDIDNLQNYHQLARVATHRAVPLIITDVVLVHLYYLPKAYTVPIFPAKAGKGNYKLAENWLQKNDIMVS